MSDLYSHLADFAAEVHAKLKLAGAGEPEDQLRAPLEKCIQAFGVLFQIKVVCKGEFYIRDIGRPDYAVYCNGALCGYIEIKQPGKGANASRYQGHDKKQWESFKSLPNIFYTDGNEWALYRNGKLIGGIIRLKGNIATEGKKAVSPGDASALELTMREFLTWNPIAPRDSRGLAKLLAPLCRLLREEVKTFLQDKASPFCLLYAEWQTTLFPGQSPERFADAYAQTLTFSLLLANAEGGDVLDLHNAEASLASGHMLLSKALKIFTDNLKPQELPIALGLLQRIIAAVPQAGFKSAGQNPWLYFYEDFLAEYDPKLRKDSGSYYTPLETVQAMTSLTQDLLVRRMGKKHGFAGPDVMTLDPAAGTGAFLLDIIAQTLAPIGESMGPGAVSAYADALARQLHGFELQVGPYAVAQLRLSRALMEHGALLPPDGLHLYLVDTLESPDITPQFPSLLSRELSEQHKKAIEVKKSLPVLVCIGNPPYDRHEAADARNRKETGGWVRWGEEDAEGKYHPDQALMEDFTRPVRTAGQGGQLKNIYNLYVYFWRWALWKVFEQKDDTPGIVNFITASSFLEGPAFAGMREALRRLCHEVWIIDLGGDGRGARREENIFNIQTPVCIALAVRFGVKDRTQPADIHYARIAGNREEKLAALKSITGFGSLSWQACATGWQDALMPLGKGDYFSFPLLTDIFPWQQSGIKAGRTWVIGTDRDVLERRWKRIFQTDDAETRRELFKDAPPSTGGRKILDSPNGLFSDSRLKAIGEPGQCGYEKIIACGYRSFDSQYVLADARCLDRPGPALWRTQSDKQIYFATKFSQIIGSGPALTLSGNVPDMNFFCNRGAKDILPLWRDAAATEANIMPGLLCLLEQDYRKPVSAEDLAAYVYALLAQGSFAEKFHSELASRQIRVPLTRNAALFDRAAGLGRHLIWLHSYGSRLTPEGMARGHVPPGAAKCRKAVPCDADGYPESFSYNEATQTLNVGRGEFAPVSQEVWLFEVSGFKVVQSWLKYRMKERSGRKSSPLDDIRPERWTAEYTESLLHLLWVLEHTLKSYPDQQALLEEILAGELVDAGQLPAVPDEAREAPVSTKRASASQNSLFSSL